MVNCHYVGDRTEYGAVVVKRNYVLETNARPRDKFTILVSHSTTDCKYWQLEY